MVVATHGILTSSSFWLTEKSEKDWEYFRVSGSMNPRFVPDGHGHAELVILVSLFRQRIPICIPPYCVLIYDL